MGTAGRGRVLEFWLLGPDVVVEPGEKLADTRAAETHEEEEVVEEEVFSRSSSRAEDAAAAGWCQPGRKEVRLESAGLFAGLHLQ